MTSLNQLEHFFQRGEVTLKMLKFVVDIESKGPQFIPLFVWMKQEDVAMKWFIIQSSLNDDFLMCFCVNFLRSMCGNQHQSIIFQPHINRLL